MGFPMKTIFEKIIDNELPADKIYENERIIVIRDKFPKAPIHLLIITKKVIANMQSIESEDFSLVGEVFQIAKKLAKDFGLEEGGYRLVVNNGPNAGQIIPHLHFHILAGRPLGEMG